MEVSMFLCVGRLVRPGRECTCTDPDSFVAVKQRLGPKCLSSMLGRDPHLQASVSQEEVSVRLRGIGLSFVYHNG